MSTEEIGLKRDTVPSVISDCTVAATHTMKTIIRRSTGTKWRLLLTIAVGALLAVVAMKLMALLGSAFDISFLRDVGSNAGPGAAAGGAGAGLGGGAAGGGGDGSGGDPPGPPPQWAPQYGPPRPYMHGDQSTFAGWPIWFAQGIQHLAWDIMGNEGRTGQGYGSSGSAGKA
jgi:hypothetical protein